jgi:hypothetical protein
MPPIAPVIKPGTKKANPAFIYNVFSKTPPSMGKLGLKRRSEKCPAKLIFLQKKCASYLYKSEWRFFGSGYIFFWQTLKSGVQENKKLDCS